MQNGAAGLFDALSALLVFEAEMLKNFEAKMHVAMTRFTGTEYENELALKKLQADQQAQSIREDTADSQFEALLHRIGLTVEDLVPPQHASSAATSNTSTTSSGDAGSASTSGPVAQPGQKTV